MHIIPMHTYIHTTTYMYYALLPVLVAVRLGSCVINTNRVVAVLLSMLSKHNVDYIVTTGVYMQLQRYIII